MGKHRSLERAQGFCFGYNAIAQHFGVKDAIACQIDDACCDDFSVAKLTIDVERDTGPLQCFGHCLDGVLIESGIVFEIATYRHNAGSL